MLWLYISVNGKLKICSKEHTEKNPKRLMHEILSPPSNTLFQAHDVRGLPTPVDAMVADLAVASEAIRRGPARLS